MDTPVIVGPQSAYKIPQSPALTINTLDYLMLYISSLPIGIRKTLVNNLESLNNSGGFTDFTTANEGTIDKAILPHIFEFLPPLSLIGRRRALRELSTLFIKAINTKMAQQDSEKVASDQKEEDFTTLFGSIPPPNAPDTSTKRAKRREKRKSKSKTPTFIGSIIRDVKNQAIDKIKDFGYQHVPQVMNVVDKAFMKRNTKTGQPSDKFDPSSSMLSNDRNLNLYSSIDNQLGTAKHLSNLNPLFAKVVAYAIMEKESGNTAPLMYLTMSMIPSPNYSRPGNNLNSRFKTVDLSTKALLGNLDGMNEYVDEIEGGWFDWLPKSFSNVFSQLSDWKTWQSVIDYAYKTTDSAIANLISQRAKLAKEVYYVPRKVDSKGKVLSVDWSKGKVGKEKFGNFDWNLSGDFDANEFADTDVNPGEGFITALIPVAKWAALNLGLPALIGYLWESYGSSMLKWACESYYGPSKTLSDRISYVDSVVKSISGGDDLKKAVKDNTLKTVTNTANDKLLNLLPDDLLKDIKDSDLDAKLVEGAEKVDKTSTDGNKEQLMITDGKENRVPTPENFVGNDKNMWVALSQGLAEKMDSVNNTLKANVNMEQLADYAFKGLTTDPLIAYQLTGDMDDSQTVLQGMSILGDLCQLNPDVCAAFLSANGDIDHYVHNLRTIPEAGAHALIASMAQEEMANGDFTNAEHLSNPIAFSYLAEEDKGTGDYEDSEMTDGDLDDGNDLIGSLSHLVEGGPGNRKAARQERRETKRAARVTEGNPRGKSALGSFLMKTTSVAKKVIAKAKALSETTLGKIAKKVLFTAIPAMASATLAKKALSAASKGGKALKAIKMAAKAVAAKKSFLSEKLSKNVPNRSSGFANMAGDFKNRLLGRNSDIRVSPERNLYTPVEVVDNSVDEIFHVRNKPQQNEEIEEQPTEQDTKYEESAPDPQTEEFPAEVQNDNHNQGRDGSDDIENPNDDEIEGSIWSSLVGKVVQTGTKFVKKALPVSMKIATTTHKLGASAYEKLAGRMIGNTFLNKIMPYSKEAMNSAGNYTLGALGLATAGALGYFVYGGFKYVWNGVDKWVKSVPATQNDKDQFKKISDKVKEVLPLDVTKAPKLADPVSLTDDKPDKTKSDDWSKYWDDEVVKTNSEEKETTPKKDDDKGTSDSVKDEKSPSQSISIPFSFV